MQIWYWRVISRGDELCIDFPKLNSIVIGKGCFGGGYCVLIESVISEMEWNLDLPELTTFMFGLDAFCFDRIDEDTEFTMKSCHDGWNSQTDLPKLTTFKGPRHRMHTFAELKHAHFICAIGISKWCIALPAVVDVCLPLALNEVDVEMKGMNVSLLLRRCQWSLFRWMG